MVYYFLFRFSPKLYINDNLVTNVCYLRIRCKIPKNEKKKKVF